MSEAHSALAHQFDDLEQQKSTDTLGMWVFLGTEIMFFGGLFLGYAIYRHLYYQAFAIGSRLLEVSLGAVNTTVLILSSLTMAMSVHSAHTGKRKALIVFLLLTMLFGTVFLGIKGYEYYEKFEEHIVPGSHFHFEGPYAPEVELFMSFYFVMTGMHALHMIIGLGLVSYLVVKAYYRAFSPEYFAPVEIIGLYWHFVDIVWIFLFPVLYLVDRHH